MDTKENRRKRNLRAGKLKPKGWSPMPPTEVKDKNQLEKRRAKAKRARASRKKNRD